MAEFTLLYMIGSAAIHILIEVLTHAARFHDEHVVKWNGKPVNDDLQKALKRSYFSALQAIALECQQANQEKGEQKVWLAKKVKELAVELKKFSPSENKVEDLFASLDDIQSLLVSNTQLTEYPQLTEEVNNQNEIREQLINLALAEATEAPVCYQTQIKQRLFEEFRDYFIREVKFNKPVYKLLMARSQAEASAKTNQQMNDLLKELRSFKATTSWQAKIKLDIDLNSGISDAQLLKFIEMIRQQGLTTLRIEAGSVIVMVVGSKKDIYLLKDLTEIAGCRIENIIIIPDYFLSETPITSLLKWLQKQFKESVTTGWQPLDEIFGSGELAFKFRTDKIQRAKELNLGNDVLLVLIIQVEEKLDDIQVTLEVHAQNKEKLPTGLTLSVFQDIGESQTNQVGEGDNYLRQEWLFSRQETFTVTVSLGNIQVTEKFSI